MSTVSVYLNFPGTTEEAFTFYKKVFKSEFQGEMMRMGDVPPQEGVPPLPENEKNLVMHVSLPVFKDFLLMGTDTLDSMGMKVTMGNNMHINLLVDTRAETDRLFAELSEGGKVTMPLQDMFWGDYYGSCTDKFGVQWMVNCSEKK